MAGVSRRPRSDARGNGEEGSEDCSRLGAKASAFPGHQANEKYHAVALEGTFATVGSETQVGRSGRIAQQAPGHTAQLQTPRAVGLPVVIGRVFGGRASAWRDGPLRGQGLPGGSRVSFRCKEGSILVGRRETDGSCHWLAGSRWSPDTAGRRAENRQHRLVQTSVRREHVPLLQEPGIAGWLGHLAPCFADEQRASRQVPR